MTIHKPSVAEPQDAAPAADDTTNSSGVIAGGRSLDQIPDLEKPVMELLVETRQEIRELVISWVLQYARARDEARVVTGHIADTDLWEAFAGLLEDGKPRERNLWMCSFLRSSIEKLYGYEAYQDFSLEDMGVEPIFQVDEIFQSAALIVALENAYGEAATAVEWAKVIEHLQSILTPRYEQSHQTMGVGGKGGQGSELPSDRPPGRPLRNRRGYVPPAHEGKSWLKAMLDDEAHKNFGDLARKLGVTQQMLLSFLATEIGTRAATDTEFLDALQKRLADEAARRNASGTGMLKSASSDLIKKTFG